MRYRAKSAKVQSDSSVLSDISKGTVRAANRALPIFGPFIYLYDYIVGTLAFITRGFLRVKLGSRTFGLFTFAFLLLFTWISLYYREVFLQFYSELVNMEGLGEGLLGQISVFFMSIFGAFLGMFAGLLYLATPTEEGFSLFPEFTLPIMILLAVTLLLSLYHLRDVRGRKKSGEVIHSQYRGDSLLFDWLEGKNILGKKMTPENIWLIVEPLTVFLIATGIWIFTQWHDLAYLLMVSGICLFLEEYKVYKENKELEYNTIDQLLDAKYYDYLQKVIQERIKASEQEFAQKEYRASFEEGDPRFGVTKRNPSGAKFRAKVL
jgi:hypothetical protein